MPCLTELHTLFYPNGVKIIPHNIYELLTPVALAHLIMGDGSVQRHGLIICTNSYSIEDVVLLMNVLIIRYELECKIREKRQNQKIEYLIYIRQGSMAKLHTIVWPYMHHFYIKWKIIIQIYLYSFQWLLTPILLMIKLKFFKKIEANRESMCEQILLLGKYI